MKPQAVIVWDLPLRLFHWSWAAAFAAAWLTRGDRWLYFHLLAGYLFGALLLFRLAWGFTGTREARFSAFTYPAREVRGYLRQIVGGTPPRHLGHNPPGSWAIWLMLMLGLLLFFSGVATLGAEERQGPLSGFLDFTWVERLHESHELLAWILMGVVGLHLLGVAVERRIHRENLVASMITGRKPVHGNPPPAVPRRGGIAIALALGLSSFAVVWSWPWWVADDASPFPPFPGHRSPITSSGTRSVEPAIWPITRVSCPPTNGKRSLRQRRTISGKTLHSMRRFFPNCSPMLLPTPRKRHLPRRPGSSTGTQRRNRALHVSRETRIGATSMLRFPKRSGGHPGSMVATTAMPATSMQPRVGLPIAPCGYPPISINRNLRENNREQTNPVWQQCLRARASPAGHDHIQHSQ